ncbi:MAG: Crp/Fnr family transcriptional regulator [Tissierellia bacterium]|nr:Crp/Fnr family transcriptional regulator [Tissierellia bacterium]
MNSSLFLHLTNEDVEKYLKDVYASINDFDAGEYIFKSGDNPQYLMILLEGSLQVEFLDETGKRIIINRFTEPGTVVGEVFLCLNNTNYEYDLLAVSHSRVLFIDGDRYKNGKGNAFEIVRENMTSILASKAYYLNRRLVGFSAYSLRRRIIEFLNIRADDKGMVNLKMTRGEMADFLGVTRPSLSRELMKMKDEKLIEINNKDIILL